MIRNNFGMSHQGTEVSLGDAPHLPLPNELEEQVALESGIFFQKRYGSRAVTI